jgi:hypothetical protein
MLSSVRIRRQRAGPASTVGLADAIEALRAALTDAVHRGDGQPMRFEVQPVELTVQAVITKDANGKVGWSALGVGASYQSAVTQTLKLELKPLWQNPDGTVRRRTIIADPAGGAQRFGPAPLPGESGGPSTAAAE